MVKVKIIRFHVFNVSGYYTYIMALYTGKKIYQQLISDHYYICNVYMFRGVGMDHILSNKGKSLNYFQVSIYILLIYSIVSYEYFYE